MNTIPKTFLRVLRLWILPLGFSAFVPPALAVDSCIEDSRNQDLCYSMKHLRSYLMMLDAQRERMKVDYQYVSDLSLGMAIHVEDILDVHYHDEDQRMPAVGIAARQVWTLAMQEDANALLQANALRDTCAACHSRETNGGTGTFDNIMSYNWRTISARCNEIGKNPIVCKHMHGFVHAITYFQTSTKVPFQDYASASRVLGEIYQIAGTLMKLGPNIHPSGSHPLAKIQRRARYLRSLAKKKIPACLKKGPLWQKRVTLATVTKKHLQN